LVDKVLLVNGAPILPLLHDFLAVKQHAAEYYAGRPTSSFLAVMNLQRFPDFSGKGAVQFAFELVDVIDGAAFTKVV
jgi:hypothetical protein